MIFDPSFLIDLLRQEAQVARLWHPQRKAAGTTLFDQGAMATHGWILEGGLVKLGSKALLRTAGCLLAIPTFQPVSLIALARYAWKKA
jgi:hypothetical protein